MHKPRQPFIWINGHTNAYTLIWAMNLTEAYDVAINNRCYHHGVCYHEAVAQYLNHGDHIEPCHQVLIGPE